MKYLIRLIIGVSLAFFATVSSAGDKAAFRDAFLPPKRRGFLAKDTTVL